PPATAERRGTCAPGPPARAPGPAGPASRPRPPTAWTQVPSAPPGPRLPWPGSHAATAPQPFGHPPNPVPDRRRAVAVPSVRAASAAAGGGRYPCYPDVARTTGTAAPGPRHAAGAV